MSYKIIGDEALDLTTEMKKNKCIVNVPMDISIDDVLYMDKTAILEAMKRSKNAPKTACPSIGDYMAELNDKDDIYIITVSAKLSGSFSAAKQAVEIFQETSDNKNIHVFDSMSASAGETLVAIKIKEYIEKGMLFNNIVEKIEQFISNLDTLFVLESLDNLIKNGRLTKMQAAITTAARIKLICGSNKDGEIISRGKALSINISLKKIVDLIDASDEDHIKTMVIAHCNCKDRAIKLKEMIIKKIGCTDIHIVETQNMSTTYANDGGIVLAF